VKESNEQILKDAVDTFGVTNQMDMTVEECAELIQAINKIKRTFNPSHLLGLRDGKLGFSDTKQALIYGNLCSEIADVKIMIGQLEYLFNPETIQISYERKLSRLQERIENHKKENK
jgi:NTP pyrophosphatase (non-canonical NTP hydrolase)